MPTQSTPEEVTAEATGATRNDKARARALAQAKADSKALFDVLRAAAERDQDADVRAGLVAAAKARLALVSAALEQI
jgi:hypothetical protein